MRELLDIMEEAFRAENLIIYGAHLVAKEVYQWLERSGRDFHFVSFAVTGLEGNPGQLCGRKVATLTELTGYRENSLVLIALPEKYKEQVIDYLEEKGFRQYRFIGLYGASKLLGDECIEQCNQKGNDYFLYQDGNDCTWLNVGFDSEGQEHGQAERHYKFPALSRLTIEERLRRLWQVDLIKEYDRLCGTYRNLHAMPTNLEGVEDDISQEVAIYMVRSHKDSRLKNEYPIPEWIRSIQAGSVLTKNEIGEYMDKTGQQISDRNPNYTEMTAMYWIWKNSPGTEYKGLCHYRRHFMISEKEIRNLKGNSIDIVLTMPRLVLEGIQEMFVADTTMKSDMICDMVESVKELYGDEQCQELKRYLKSIFYYPNNMLIARCEVFEAYCEWIFPILFRLEEKDDEAKRTKMDRHMGYAAEILTSFFFVRNKDSYKIAITDYVFYH